MVEKEKKKKVTFLIDNSLIRNAKIQSLNEDIKFTQFIKEALKDRLEKGKKTRKNSNEE